MRPGGPLSAPEPLVDRHLIDEFRCTEPDLERWLKQRARRNQLEGASRTFVVCQGLRVVGYYCLAAGAVAHAAAPGNIRRNMPDPVPVMVLGRLAVDTGWAGRGVGQGLLKDAILRTVRVAGETGVRALLAHAMSPTAKAFYLKNGFRESPIEPLTVMLNVAALARE
ncbi:MAG: GNAT family N-acetyltransferase [Betaproteobacteria bacterium RIFCSPLOWO2_12_FULL_62_58]|nr:MAG: GNAT family N-acetyltransferase [Betaproteobacteria bacterium RIFCSPLOWO2_12_FULL_62_58]